MRSKYHIRSVVWNPYENFVHATPYTSRRYTALQAKLIAHGSPSQNNDLLIQNQRT
jgi:hypothetical protein